MKHMGRLSISSGAGGMAYSAAVTGYIILSLIVSLIAKLGGFAGTDGYRYFMYLLSPLAIGGVLTLALACFKQPVKELLPIKTNPKYVLIGILLIFGLLFSLNWVNEYFIKLLQLLGYTRKNNPLPDISGWKLVPAFIFIALIPAISEEILFRGIILNNTQSGAGSVRTIFIVGFCFALYHGSAEQTIYQFVCGCLFAFLAIRSHSITPCVIIHFINNALIITLYALGYVDVSGNLILPQYAQIALYVSSAVCLVGATLWLIFDGKLFKVYADGKTELCLARYRLVKGQKGGVRQFFMYASAGIVSMAILWITGLF